MVLTISSTTTGKLVSVTWDAWEMELFCFVSSLNGRKGQAWRAIKNANLMIADYRIAYDSEMKVNFHRIVYICLLWRGEATKS